MVVHDPAAVVPDECITLVMEGGLPTEWEKIEREYYDYKGDLQFVFKNEKAKRKKSTVSCITSLAELTKKAVWRSGKQPDGIYCTALAKPYSEWTHNDWEWMLMFLDPSVKNNNDGGGDPSKLYHDEVFTVRRIIRNAMPTLEPHLEQLKKAGNLKLWHTHASGWYHVDDNKHRANMNRAVGKWLKRRQEALRLAEVEAQKLREVRALAKKLKDEAALARAKRTAENAENQMKRLQGMQAPAPPVAQGSAIAAVALGALEDLPITPLNPDEQWLSYVANMEDIQEYEAKLLAEGSFLTRDLARKWIIDNNMVPPHLKNVDWVVCHIFCQKWFQRHHSRLYFLAPASVNGHFHEWLTREWANYVGKMVWEMAETFMIHNNLMTFDAGLKAMINYDDKVAKAFRHQMGKKIFVSDDEGSTSTAPAPKRLKVDDDASDEEWF